MTIDSILAKDIENPGGSSFYLGFDFVISPEGDPKLLEPNLSPGNLGHPITRSRVAYFMSAVLLHKADYPIILGDLMPPRCTNPEDFYEFAKQYSGQGVVYKADGSRGERVSIFNPPKDWNPTYVEAFIDSGMSIRGKRFPAVYRSVVELKCSNTLTWKIKEIFAKVGSKPIEDLESGIDPNQVLKLSIHPADQNIQESRKEYNLGHKKEELITKYTEMALKRMAIFGTTNRWNPRKAFPTRAVYNTYLADVDRIELEQVLSKEVTPHEVRVYRASPIVSTEEFINWGTDLIFDRNRISKDRCNSKKGFFRFMFGKKFFRVMSIKGEEIDPSTVLMTPSSPIELKDSLLGDYYSYVEKHPFTLKQVAKLCKQMMDNKTAEHQVLFTDAS